jgi:tetratricopeptide (TPR) repeat protein
VQVEPSLAECVPDHRPIDGPEYRLVVEHCRENLEDFAALCAERHVPLLLCTVVTNLREFPPLADVFDPRTPEAERAHWDELVDEAAAAATAGDADTSLARLQQAEAIDDRPARLAFVRGQALLAAGRDREAGAAFRRARDTDGRLNRAVSDLNDLVRGFDGRPGVTVVDLESFFDQRAPHGIAGHEAIVDHLHPTVEGQALIAVRLLQAFADAHLFTTPEQLAQRGLYDPSATFEQLIDEADLALRGGLENLQLALEKGRWDDTAASARASLLEALRLSSEPAAALAGLGLLEGLHGSIEASRDYFQRAASADPQVLHEWRRRAAGSALVALLLRRADMLEPKGGPASECGGR